MKRTAVLQLGWLASQTRAAIRFARAQRQPERTLGRRWDALHPVLSRSKRGASLSLDRFGEVHQIRRLPVMDGDALEPWAARIAAGERAVLTAEPVEMMEPTSGGRGPRKLIPYTARLRAEFAEAVAVWMVDLHARTPGLLGTKSYWSVSRAVRDNERTTGGLPIGFSSDAAYFDPLSQWAIRQLMAVSDDVARAQTLAAWRRRTLRQLVDCAELGLISVWSPSFLTQLLEALDAEAPEMISTSTRLKAAFDGKRVDVRTLWPRLQVVSAWGDGFAGRLLPALRARLGGIAVQPKGVLATEGVVSVPVGDGPGHVLAITSHLIELRDVQDQSVCWPHEARLGGQYQALITTGGGLLRYAMPDCLEVVGWAGRIPRVRLVGRLDGGSDLVGEKLTEPFVQATFARLWPRPPAFAMLVSRSDPLGYVLVCSEPVDAASAETALQEAYHYRYARELGQLAPVEVCCRPDAWARWERGVEQSGGTLGDQKPGVLETRPQVVAVLLAD